MKAWMSSNVCKFATELRPLIEGSQGELIGWESSRHLSVCASINIFKLEYLRNQWANRNEILSEPLLGWGKGCIRFCARSDRIGTLVSMATDSSHRVIMGKML